MTKPKKIKIKYVQVKTNPEETQRRLDKTFDILFNEVDNFTAKHGIIKNKSK